jgi:LytS/YehU family sensor histidine kinase
VVKPDPISFWPHSRSFWAYHVGAMLVIVLLSLLSVALWRALDPAYVLSTVLWMLPYTLVALLLRWLYHARFWSGQTMARLIPWVLAYSTAAGLAVAAAVSALVMPLAGGEFSLRSIVSGGLQAQLFIGAWAFIYISIQTQQRQREAELRNLRLEMGLKEAQLRQLSEQLKPHFLFNALNNIRFMVQEDGPKAERMVVALSGMLRYSLESSRRDKRPLGEELATLHDYLALMGSQLEDRLRVALAVEPGLEACLVPPMLLQLLVENAIKHGLEALPQGGLLRLAVARVGTQLRLSVGNDRAEAASDGKQHLGLGLTNIERRLQLLYGERAQLQLQPGDRWFEVVLQIPLEQAA